MTSASDEKWRPFNCFFQSGRSKDLSAALCVEVILAIGTCGVVVYNVLREVVPPSEDRGSIFLRNIVNCLPDHTASQTADL